MARTKIKAGQVDEDTLQDKDGDTKIEVEEQADGDEIVFTTAGQPRMILDSTGQLGIGVESASQKLDVNGDIRIRGNNIQDNSGGNVIEMDGSGYLKFTKGIKYARGVLVSSASSPAENGGWIKFASMSSPGTSNLDTAASSFLICFAGQDSTNNRQLDGLFLVHAKHTVNTEGSGTDGDAITNAYYEPEGTFIVCEPLHSKVMSASGVDPFDPLTDLLMIAENDNGTPQVDLYIKCCAKQKRCFVTHLGGTGQENTPDTDIGFEINTGETWSTSEPTAPAGSVKLTGDYVDKIFNNVSLNDITAYGSITTENNITFQDNNGTFPTNSPGFFWDLNNDEARIYAEQPSSDAINFVFKLSDNNGDSDRFIFWVEDYRGTSYDRYPLYMHGDEINIHAPPSGTSGTPDTANAKIIIPRGTTSGTTTTHKGRLFLDGDNSSDLYIRFQNNTEDAYVFQDQSDSNRFKLESANDICFNTNGANERMRIESTGDVGIGTTNPVYRLDVQDTTTSFVMNIQQNSSTAGADMLRMDFSAETDPTGQIIYVYDQDNDRIYQVVGNGAGGSTVNTSFTSGHDTVVPQGVNVVPGMIVESTGEVWYKPTDVTYETALPKCQLASTDGSKKVFGVVAGYPVPASPSEIEQPYVHNGFVMAPSFPSYARKAGVSETEWNIGTMSIGEGVIWVTNINGEIENGDYIESSVIQGYGRKQSDDIMRSKTVAKCTEDIDWSTVAETVVYDNVTYKRYLASCTFHCG